MARPKAATTPTSSKSHKRQLSSSATLATTTPGSRVSKRLKEAVDNTPTNRKTTSKKSKYFEGTDSENEDEDVADSGYEDEDVSATEASPSVQSSEGEEYSEEDTNTKKKRGRKPKSPKGGTRISGDNSRELWREGVKTGLGPGKQVFIEKPKPRGDGGVKYVPGRIHPNTMEFLADLKKNNDREWLKSEY
jgi:hypothetical protein